MACYPHGCAASNVAYQGRAFIQSYFSGLCCCQVLWNLAEAFRINTAGSCELYVNELPSVATLNQISRLRCQGHSAGLTLNRDWISARESLTDSTTCELPWRAHDGWRRRRVAESSAVHDVKNAVHYCPIVLELQIISQTNTFTFVFTQVFVSLLDCLCLIQNRNNAQFIGETALAHITYFCWTLLTIYFWVLTALIVWWDVCISVGKYNKVKIHRLLSTLPWRTANNEPSQKLHF